MQSALPNLDDQTHQEFYALVGRVSLLLVERNIDAITTANFLREIAANGGPRLDRQQVGAIARPYLERAVE